MAGYMDFLDVQALGNDDLAQLLFEQLFEDSDGEGSAVDSDSGNEGVVGDEEPMEVDEENDGGGVDGDEKTVFSQCQNSVAPLDKKSLLDECHTGLVLFEICYPFRNI